MNKSLTNQESDLKNIDTSLKDEMTIIEFMKLIMRLLKYLFTKWHLILGLSLIGGTIGYIYAYFQKPLYEATLTFALEDDKGSTGGGLSSLASLAGVDFSGGAGTAFSGNNLSELMKSRRMVELTLLDSVYIRNKPTTLADWYLDFTKMRQSFHDDPGLRKIAYPIHVNQDNFSRLQDSVLGVIYENILSANLSVGQRDKKISIISVVVTSGDEAFSKLFAEKLVENVSDFYIDTKSKKARMNLTILEHQTDSIRAQLNAAIGGVASANDIIYNLNPALNVNRVPSSRRQIDVQANTAILTQLVTNLELARVTLRKETPLIQIIDLPVYPLRVIKMRKKNLFIGGFVIMAVLTSTTLVIRKRVRELGMSD